MLRDAEIVSALIIFLSVQIRGGEDVGDLLGRLLRSRCFVSQCFYCKSSLFLNILKATRNVLLLRQISSPADSRQGD